MPEVTFLLDLVMPTSRRDTGLYLRLEAHIITRNDELPYW